MHNLLILGGVVAFFALHTLAKHMQPVAPLTYKYTLDSFRSGPITTLGETNQFTGIDRLSYKKYRSEALAGIDVLNARKFSPYGISNNDPVKAKIIEKVKLMEFLERNNGYKNLNENIN